MNKRDLVDKIAAEANITKTQAAWALESFLDGVRNSLVRGKRVTLMGFGTFAVSQRKARRVLDPRRGTSIEISARRVARFAPGVELKMAVESAPIDRTVAT